MLAIPIEKNVGQAYDGAAAISSEKRGCQGRIKSLNQLALYTHCRSHVLNLSIAAACKIPIVRNMIDVLNSVFIFFDSSPKRQWFLETIIENDGSVDFSRKKLVRHCKTRWVERHICFDVFYNIYKLVIKYLQQILKQNIDDSTREDWFWDRKSDRAGAFSFDDVLLCVDNICVCKICPRYNKAFDSNFRKEILIFSLQVS